MVEIYRPGAASERFIDAPSEIAARITGFTVTDDVKPAGSIDSKFGAVPLVDFAIAARTIRRHAPSRRCLGFARPFDEPVMQIAGWYCSAGEEVVDRATLACALDRLTMLSAGGDAKLAGLFARAEIKRTFCGQRSPILAATPEHEVQVATRRAAPSSRAASNCAAGCRSAERRRLAAETLRPVILGEIIGDGLGVVVADRRAERLDHLGDLGVPAGGIEERRIHLDVVEAVTGAAIALNLIEARARA